MNISLVAQRLSDSISSVAPIVGVAISTMGNSNSCRIDFQPIATVPQRSAAQSALAAFDWSQTAQDAWELQQRRVEAKAALAEAKAESATLRALLLIVLDEFNLHSAKTNAILTAIDNAATLAALKTAVAAITDLPTRTAAQLRTAIQNKIDAGDVDT